MTIDMAMGGTLGRMGGITKAISKTVNSMGKEFGNTATEVCTKGFSKTIIDMAMGSTLFRMGRITLETI